MAKSKIKLCYLIGNLNKPLKSYPPFYLPFIRTYNLVKRKQQTVQSVRSGLAFTFFSLLIVVVVDVASILELPPDWGVGAILPWKCFSREFRNTRKNWRLRRHFCSLRLPIHQSLGLNDFSFLNRIKNCTGLFKEFVTFYSKTLTIKLQTLWIALAL